MSAKPQLLNVLPHSLGSISFAESLVNRLGAISADMSTAENAGLAANVASSVAFTRRWRPSVAGHSCNRSWCSSPASAFDLLKAFSDVDALNTYASTSAIRTSTLP